MEVSHYDFKSDLVPYPYPNFSHWHFDHTGDPSLFPKSADLIVGPGVPETFLPGYPANPESQLAEDAFT